MLYFDAHIGEMLAHLGPEATLDRANWLLLPMVRAAQLEKVTGANVKMDLLGELR